MTRTKLSVEISSIYQTEHVFVSKKIYLSCIGKQNVVGKSSKRFEKNLRKDARRNQLLQYRKKKREQVFAQKRNLGGSSSAPVLICIISLHSDTDVKDIVSVVTSMDETVDVATSPNGIIHIKYGRRKNLFSLSYYELLMK